MWKWLEIYGTKFIMWRSVQLCDPMHVHLGCASALHRDSIMCNRLVNVIIQKLRLAGPKRRIIQFGNWRHTHTHTQSIIHMWICTYTSWALLKYKLLADHTTNNQEHAEVCTHCDGTGWIYIGICVSLFQDCDWHRTSMSIDTALCKLYSI